MALAQRRARLHEIGHVEIEQHDVRGAALRQGQRLTAVASQAGDLDALVGGRAAVPSRMRWSSTTAPETGGGSIASRNLSRRIPVAAARRRRPLSSRRSRWPPSARSRRHLGPDP